MMACGGPHRFAVRVWPKILMSAFDAVEIRISLQLEDG